MQVSNNNHIHFRDFGKEAPNATPGAPPRVTASNITASWAAVSEANAALDQRHPLKRGARPPLRIVIKRDTHGRTLTVTSGSIPRPMDRNAQLDDIETASANVATGKVNLETLKEKIYDLRSQLALGDTPLRITFETPQGAVVVQDNGSTLALASKPIEGDLAYKDRVVSTPGSRHTREPNTGIYMPRRWPPPATSEPSTPAAGIADDGSSPQAGQEVTVPQSSENSFDPILGARLGTIVPRHTLTVFQEIRSILAGGRPDRLINSIAHLRYGLKLADIPLRIGGVIKDPNSDNTISTIFAVLDFGGNTYVMIKDVKAGGTPTIYVFEHPGKQATPAPKQLPTGTVIPGPVNGGKGFVHGVGFGWGVYDAFAGIQGMINGKTPDDRFKSGILAGAGITTTVSDGIGVASIFINVGPVGAVGTVASVISAILYKLYIIISAADATLKQDNEGRAIERELDYLHELLQLDQADTMFKERLADAQSDEKSLSTRYGAPIGTLTLNNNSAETLNMVNDGVNSASGQWKQGASDYSHRYIEPNKTHHKDVTLDLNEPPADPQKYIATEWPYRFEAPSLPTQAEAQQIYTPHLYHAMQDGWQPRGSTARKEYKHYELSLLSPSGDLKPSHRVVAGTYYASKKTGRPGIHAVLIDDTKTTAPSTPFTRTHSGTFKEFSDNLRVRNEVQMKKEFSLAPTPRPLFRVALSPFGKELNGVIDEAIDLYAKNPTAYPFPEVPSAGPGVDAFQVIAKCRAFINGIYASLKKAHPDRAMELERARQSLQARFDYPTHYPEIVQLVNLVDQLRNTKLQSNSQLAFGRPGRFLIQVMRLHAAAKAAEGSAKTGQNPLRHQDETARQAIQRDIEYLRKNGLDDDLCNELLARLDDFSDADLEASFTPAGEYLRYSLIEETYVEPVMRSAEESFPVQKGQVLIRSPDSFTRTIITQRNNPDLVVLRGLYHDTQITLSHAQDIIGIEQLPEANVTIQLPSTRQTDQRKLVLAKGVNVTARSYSNDGTSCSLALSNGKRISIEASDATSCRRLAETAGI